MKKAAIFLWERLCSRLKAKWCEIERELFKNFIFLLCSVIMSKGPSISKTCMQPIFSKETLTNRKIQESPKDTLLNRNCLMRQWCVNISRLVVNIRAFGCFKRFYIFLSTSDPLKPQFCTYSHLKPACGEGLTWSINDDSRHWQLLPTLGDIYTLAYDLRWLWFRNIETYHF